MHSFVLFDVCIDSEADRHSDAGFRNEWCVLYADNSLSFLTF